MNFRPARMVVAALAVPLVLSACSLLGENKPPPPCPPIYILGDASTLTRFRPGPGRDLTDVDFEAEIVGYHGSCTYTPKGAEVSLQVRIDAKRGPANASRKADLSYFVAIPHFYPKPQAKAVLPVNIEFPEGANGARFTDEEVVMSIPLGDGELIDKYEIYLGFQASPEELEHNREGRRR